MFRAASRSSETGIADLICEYGLDGNGIGVRIIDTLFLVFFFFFSILFISFSLRDFVVSIGCIMTFYIQDLPYDLMIFPHVLSYSVGFFTNLYIELLFIDIYRMLLISTPSHLFYTACLSTLPCPVYIDRNTYYVDNQNQKDNRNRVSISYTHITSSI